LTATLVIWPSATSVHSGISFLLKLVDDFHCPSLSLYRRSTLAFSITAFLPFTVISFSQIAADTGPAGNFATGFAILVSSESRLLRRALFPMP
jgi:hypothetical protein